MKKRNADGFTLIEVLLALAIIAIALTSLLKASSTNVSNTNRLKEKTISHWVAMQGVSMVQLGLLSLKLNQEITQVTTLLGQRWYWRVKLTGTQLPAVDQITIRVSDKQAGPFGNTLIAFRYHPTDNK